LYVEAQISCHF